MTAKDIDSIIVSTDKLTRHGTKIEALEFGDVPVEPKKKAKAGAPFLRSIEGGE